MEFAGVVAVGGVVAEDIAVATLQFFVEGRFVDCTETAIAINARRSIKDAIGK